MDHVTDLGKEVLILRTDIENTERPVFAERTDNQLVELTLAGDESAFECIFDRHKRRIAMLTSRFFQNPAEVEEMIQISFTKAFVELKNFRGEYEYSLASWLNRIATTTCLNALKSRSAKADNLISVLSDHEKETLGVDLKQRTAEQLMIQRDLLEKLLASISAEDRVLLQMLYAEEMSAAEIADVFSWSRAKVKVRAFRARRQLGRTIKRLL